MIFLQTFDKATGRRLDAPKSPPRWEAIDLRAWREARGLRQFDACQVLGVSLSNYCIWERKGAVPARKAELIREKMR